tara:strand:- start:4527 stop:5951 length:1425 start_codon:yes stop_codon:yes gene_type:complete
MTMKVLKLPKVKSRKEWGALVLSIGLVAAGIFLLSQSQKLQKLAVLEEGLGTCFQRVAQSFTARMIGEERSVYLDKGFTGASEECFGEAASWSVQATQMAGATKVAALVNKLANEVSFFHAKIHGSDASFAKNNEVVQSSHLNSRFQAMEAVREEALADIAVAKASARGGVLRAKIAFYAFAFLCPFAFLMLWWSAREQSRTNRDVELEAQESLVSGKATLNATKTLIDRVLSNNDLPRTRDLFDRTYALLSLEGKGGLKVRTLTSNDSVSREAQIEQVWQESENEDQVASKPLPAAVKAMIRPEGPTCDLEAALSRHVDMMSGSVFTKGIRLDLNIEEGSLRVRGKNEDVEQVLFHAFSDSIRSADEGAKELSLSMKKLGGIAIVNIDVVGNTFGEEIILEAAKVARAKALSNIDLQICRELVEGIGKVSFENTGNGRRIQFVFNVAEEASTSRVVNITKATKRELKERFANS